MTDAPFEFEPVTMGFLGRDQMQFKISFEYDEEYIRKAKEIPGAKMRPANRGGPYFFTDASLDTARVIRSLYGDALQVSDDVSAWARDELARERSLGTILNDSTNELTVIPEKYPELYEALRLGPRGRYMTPEERSDYLAGDESSYQVADVAFMVACNNPLNASDMGTGKTLETLAAIVESETPGPHLVIAPKTALRTVWQKEIKNWTGQYMVVVVQGSAAEKNKAIKKAERILSKDDRAKKLIVVTNSQTIALKAEYEETINSRGKKTKKEVSTRPSFEFFTDVDWGVFVIDEFHEIGLNNPSTLTSRGCRSIQCQKKIATSGTPMGGKPMNLFGVLEFLEPNSHTSKWKWAENWLEIEKSEYGYRQITDVIREDREEDFNKMLGRYMVRRTKKEVLPWLPEIQKIYVDLDMGPKQAKQYRKFANDAEIRIDDLELSAAGVLAEYTRLKQFSNSVCDLIEYQEWDEELEEFIDKVKPIPTADSNKLDKIMEIIGELGIDDPNSEEQIVIFSQFTEFVDVIAKHLQEKGIPTGKITGAVKIEDRESGQEQFQANGGIRAMVMNTRAGGVAITLDRASTIVFTDETWNPDHQEQAEGRCHRASRIHQVTAYYLKSVDSIEDKVRKTTMAKKFTNFNILNARQEGLRA